MPSRRVLDRAVRAALAERKPRSRERTLGNTERIIALTYLVATAEVLARPADRAKGGLNNWQITRTHTKARRPRWLPIFDAVSTERGGQTLYGARLVASVALLAPTPPRVRGLADGVLAATSAVLHPRHRYGTDGSDQVAFLVAGSSALARTGRSPRITDICLWYVAMQATLSYAISGWAKIAGPAWRSGAALPGVMRTVSYGDPFGFKMTSRFPRTARVSGAAVLAMECFYPLAYAARGRLAPVFSAGALSFHLASARLMGLGRFLTAFGAMQPALLYTSVPQAALPAGEDRDDTLPRLTGLLCLAGLAAFQVDQRRRRGVVARGRGDETLFTTSRGSVLAYRRSGADTDRPLVIFEAGLGSSGDHWATFEEKFGVDGRVITYSRAGYGRSSWPRRQRFSFDAAVDDLLELVEQVAPEEPVVLMGHSLGGWIAVRAAARRPERFCALMLLDPSHPDELRRSSRQAKGSELLTDSLVFMGPSLALGLGAMLQRPAWLDLLPESMRELVAAQYRDPAQWQTTLREWRATVAEFEAFDGTLPALELPLLLLTAPLTAAQDPVQHELHAELAAASSASTHETLEKGDHMGVLTVPDVIGRVVDRTRRFLDEDLEVSTRAA